MGELKRIVILTGSELRHEYFRKKISLDCRYDVVASFCEGSENSLKNQLLQRDEVSLIERQHVLAREQSELDFFEDFTCNAHDNSEPINIAKGGVNKEGVISAVEALNPDLLICYGASIIRGRLLEVFKGKFINVHLGLSPYYRGSGTNIYPIINRELDLVGATFMYIDEGIDTGSIIHQIRADYFIGDSPHTIGNRLIKKMTDCFSDIISKFDVLTVERQPEVGGRLYLRKDFTRDTCGLLYERLKGNVIDEYLDDKNLQRGNQIVENKGLLE